MPATVSGTLDPLTLAIDGKPVLEDKTNAISIVIDGKTAPVNPGETRPFFYLTTSDPIRITVHFEKRSVDVQEIRLPELISVSLDSEAQQLVLKSDTPASWKIDDSALPERDEAKRWAVPNPDFLKTPHTVELSSATGSRSYELTFERRVEPSRAHRILAEAEISNQGRSGFLLEYGGRTASQWQWGIGFAYQSDPTLNTQGLQIELEHSLLGRLDIGAFGRALVYGGAVPSSDGDSTTLPGPGIQAGPLLQYEVWRFGALGFVLRLEEAIRLTGDNPSSTVFGGGIQLAF